MLGQGRVENDGLDRRPVARIAGPPIGATLAGGRVHGVALGEDLRVLARVGTRRSQRQLPTSSGNEFHEGICKNDS